MQLQSFLERSAAERGKTALVCGRGRWTYAELEATANRLAHGLASQGVRRGDRVAVHLDNCFEAVTSIFAVLKAGAAFLMVNPTTKAGKLRYLLGHSRASAVILPGRSLAALGDRASLADLKAVVATGPAPPSGPAAAKPCLTIDELLDRHRADDAPPPTRAIDADLAALLYTSGSTGSPKGVMLTHRNVVSVAQAIVAYLESTADEVIQCVLPLSFGYGLCQVFQSAAVGGTLVLEKSFAYPHAVMERMVGHRVTGVPLVPTLAALLLQLDLSTYDLGSLRYLTNAGAALPLEHVRRLRRTLPHVKLYSMYGQTECLRTSYLPPEQLDVRLGSVGRGIPNVEAYVVDGRGRRAAPGVVGELVVRGANVMRGYWRQPEETALALRPGPLPGEVVLYSGDLFRADAEGYLYFVSRKDDIIKSRGEKVSPQEVENSLCAHPDVAEAAVIGVPEAILGEAVKAFVALKQGCRATPQELQRHCAGRLEDFMVPRWIEIRDSLPKTANGKIDKQSLRSAACGASDPAACGVADQNVAASGSADPFPAPREPAPSPPLAALAIDPAAETERIVEAIRGQVEQLRRKGAVLGLSGGIDSSVSAALCVRALGPRRVLGIFMPEQDNSPESLELGRLLAESLGIESRVEDISALLEAAGCYRRRDEAIRRVFPDYAPDWKSKIVLPSLFADSPYRLFRLVVQTPAGEIRQGRLPLDAYQQIVAATNFKQRVRKMLEYYHADRLRYAVIGTPNRLEHDQGFFVKNGDGSADLKPIAHLYKTQVYRLAEYLGVPEPIRSRPPTTDTYSLSQSQEEFFFSLPYAQMDACLYGRDHGLPPAELAAALGLTAEQVARVYRDIDAKRTAAHYLHAGPRGVEIPAP